MVEVDDARDRSLRTTNGAFVDLFVTRGHLTPRERFGECAAGGGIRERLTSVARRREPVGERGRVAGRNNEFWTKPREGLRKPSGVAADDRRSARERLEHDETETFEGNRRNDEDVSRPVISSELLIR